MKYTAALILFIIVTFSSYGMFLFSTRARKAKDLATRLKNRSLTNISMALMLIGIAVIVVISGTPSTSRNIVFILFMFVGLINLYFGLKNVRKQP